VRYFFPDGTDWNGHGPGASCYAWLSTIAGAATINEEFMLSAQDEADVDATFERIAASHGYVSNLMQTLALAPEGLSAFALLADYTRNKSRLTPLQRELAIVVALRDVHYGWTHHAPLARAAGVTDEQLLLLREGRTPKDLAGPERVLCEYAFEVTAGRRVPLRVAEAVHEHFSARQIVDIALLTAHQMAVAALAIGLEVPMEPAETLAFEQDWQARQVAADATATSDDAAG
jgi:4-carboxymuconolactone decarboxylase